jgi:hypothetical protein
MIIQTIRLDRRGIQHEQARCVWSRPDQSKGIKVLTLPSHAAAPQRHPAATAGLSELNTDLY